MAFLMLTHTTFAAKKDKDKDEKSTQAISRIMPTFQEKDHTAFQQWLVSRIEFPKKAVRKKIGGNVIISFVIDKDGYPDKITVISSPAPVLSNEVIRVIKSSPQWVPASKDGKHLSVKLAYNVMFTI
ncbi:MAG: energy transducer TonB [Rikenellaceae bacterium]